MYRYRIGEVKEIEARISIKGNRTKPVPNSVKVRLLNARGQQLWERNGTASTGSGKYVLNDLKTRGEFKIQWVFTIGTQIIISDPFPLLVKAASEV